MYGISPELIQAVCGDGSRFGLRIEYVSEEQPLGTAGPLSLISNLTNPFLVLNGDLLTTLDFREMIRYHRNEKADFTLAVFPRQVQIDFGVVEFDRDKEFNGYREKPTYHFEVSMGVTGPSLSVVRHIKKLERLDMPELVLQVHRSGGRVACYRQPVVGLILGEWMTTPRRRKNLRKTKRHFYGAIECAIDMDHRGRRIFGPASRTVSATAAHRA